MTTPLFLLRNKVYNLFTFELCKMTERAPENGRKSSENCEINAELCPWV